MADEANEADIWATRLQFNLARSQAVLKSWLPPQDGQTQNATDDNEDDFNGFSEVAGLGAKTGDDDDIPEVLRRSRATNDKLLEQLIGKKAAQARKKQQQASKSNIATNHTAPKPVHTSRANGNNDSVQSEDEDEGRAAAFMSRKKPRQAKAPANTTVDGLVEEDSARDVQDVDPEEEESTVKGPKRTAADDDGEDENEARPRKRKPGTYLDELLAQKGKKKSKKKRKRSHETAISAS